MNNGRQDNSDKLFENCCAMLELAENDEAVRCFELYLQQNPHDHEAMNFLGEALYGMNRIADAIARFKQAIELFSEFPEALLSLGDALRRSGQFKEARDAYSTALGFVLPGEEIVGRINNGLDQLSDTQD
ncbi:MAG: tetratricopeptide repeat protein [Planctomycetales bacterium]|nr:tetratricopeptide repeat protein [Planctomycetales bacterium]